MLQRVFKLTTLCMETRSQLFPPLVNGLINNAVLQSSPRLNKPLAADKWLFWHSPGTVAIVCGWGGQTYNLLMSNQKWLKWVHFWRSYSQNKNMSVFWGHSVVYNDAVLCATRTFLCHSYYWSTTWSTKCLLVAILWSSEISNHTCKISVIQHAVVTFAHHLAAYCIR